MAIAEIMLDWGVNPRIVRVTTTDTFDEITDPGYWTAQQPNIIDLTNGAFTIFDSEIVFVIYAGGKDFFTFNATNQTFQILINIDGYDNGSQDIELCNDCMDGVYRVEEINIKIERLQKMIENHIYLWRSIRTLITPSERGPVASDKFLAICTAEVQLRSNILISRMNYVLKNIIGINND